MLCRIYTSSNTYANAAPALSQWRRNISTDQSERFPSKQRFKPSQKAAENMASLSRASKPLLVTSLLIPTCRTTIGRSSLAGIRQSSHSPLGASALTRKKVTLPTIMSMYRKQEPITMLTAHDFPSAHVADQAGMDMILVGDSLAMVALGMEDTSEVLMEEMLLHCRSVARGAKGAFTVR